MGELLFLVVLAVLVGVLFMGLLLLIFPWRGDDDD